VVELVEPTAGSARSLGVRQVREIVGELTLLNEELTYLTAVHRTSALLAVKE
jgi:hypothetical protein